MDGRGCRGAGTRHRDLGLGRAGGGMEVKGRAGGSLSPTLPGCEGQESCSYGWRWHTAGNSLDPPALFLKGQASYRDWLCWAAAMGDLSLSALGSELGAFPQPVGLSLLAMPWFPASSSEWHPAGPAPLRGPWD